MLMDCCVSAQAVDGTALLDFRLWIDVNKLWAVTTTMSVNSKRLTMLCIKAKLFLLLLCVCCHALRTVISAKDPAT
jgi:hypothetical protein